MREGARWRVKLLGLGFAQVLNVFKIFKNLLNLQKLLVRKHGELFNSIFFNNLRMYAHCDINGKLLSCAGFDTSVCMNLEFGGQIFFKANYAFQEFGSPLAA